MIRPISIILVLFFATTSIYSQKAKVDSLYNKMSDDDRIAQLFVVMDSANVSEAVLSTLPPPAFFIATEKGIGNLRKKGVEYRFKPLTFTGLQDGKVVQVKTQTIPSNYLVEAAQLSGDATTYLPYILKKTKDAGFASFAFSYSSPWVKSFNLGDIANISKPQTISNQSVTNGVLFVTTAGVQRIDLISFPYTLFDDIKQVPIKEVQEESIDSDIMASSKSFLSLIDQELEAKRLFYSTDYARDFALFKEALSNNIISQNNFKQAVKSAISTRITIVTPIEVPSDINALLQEINISRSGVTLVSNSNEFLPLLQLDTLKTTVIGLGMDNFETVTNAVKSYLPQSNSINISFSDTSSITSAFRVTNSSNLLVYAVNSASLKKINYIYLKALLRNLSKNKRSVLISFSATPKLGELKSVVNANAVVVAYDDNRLTAQIAVENILAGGDFKGKSPIRITDICDAGQGITYKATRLGNALPEEVGMDSETLLRIDDIVASGIQAKAMPGCQVLVARQGKIVFKKSYGNDQYVEPQIPTTDTTLYDVASVTKIVGSMPMVLTMHDENKLSVDSSLQSFLPHLKRTNKGDLTLKEILAHQAGLQSFIPFYENTFDRAATLSPIFSNRYNNTYSIKVDERLYFNRYTVFRKDLLDTVQSLEFSKKVARDLYILSSYKDSIYNQIDSSRIRNRGKYAYSDCGYYYLKSIIEKNYNQELDSLVTNKFYTPLGMFHTTYNPLNRFSLNQISPTEQDLMFRKQTIRGFVHDPGAAMMGGVGGHAGVFSTASDMAIMMQMYLNGGTYGGVRYISDSTLTLFTTQAFNGNRRALGFDKPEPSKNKISPVSNHCSSSSFGHTGFTGTMVWADPETQLVYIFLSNRVNPNAYNKKLIKLDIRQKIQDVIYQSITDKR